jgi:YfiR/HmsC-like
VPRARLARRLSRRSHPTASCFAVVLAVLASALVWGEDLEVPARIQVDLVGKLASYDRTFAERAGGMAVLAIVVNPGDASSARAISQLAGALKELPLIGGLPHAEVVVPWKGAANLAEVCTKRNVAIVYLAPGLPAGEVASMSKGLEGTKVLTIGSVVTYVGRGAVLGFELVSGRTKLVISLTQAKRQGVLFRAEALKLMRIVE